MVLLDGTITIVALPSIGAELRFSEQGLPWVMSAYALTFGASPTSAAGTPNGQRPAASGRQPAAGSQRPSAGGQGSSPARGAIARRKTR